MTCRSAEQEENHANDPFWSWARNQIEIYLECPQAGTTIKINTQINMRQVTSCAVRIVIALICFLPVWHADASVTIVQPANQTVSVGETVNFGATVITTAGELIKGYQWFMSATSQGPFTQVGSSAALILSNVKTNDAGYYFVTVTYQSGGNTQSISSTNVTLIVNRQPRIVTQPVSLIRPVTSNAVFSVTVGGSPPLTYQWRLNGTNLADNGRITGSTGTNLAIQNLTLGDTGNYDFVVTNLYGGATSQVATLQVIVVPPVITSPTNATGKQGYVFNYSMTATGTSPITFGATGLPDGLGMNPTNGVLSGVPTVAGVFAIGLFATNAAQTTTGNLVLTLANDIPVVTSGTSAIGKQGTAFSYTITATNDPAGFTAGTLPGNLLLDPASGIISGVPLVSGSFAITVAATNAYGYSQKTLTLNLASGAPGITSSLSKNGKQGQFLSYTITATNGPVTFSTGPLPAGLNLNPANGVISGTPVVSVRFPVHDWRGQWVRFRQQDAHLESRQRRAGHHQHADGHGRGGAAGFPLYHQGEQYAGNFFGDGPADGAHGEHQHGRHHRHTALRRQLQHSNISRQYLGSGNGHFATDRQQCSH